MGSDGGGIVAAAPTTPRRLSSQQSTLRDTFIASDIADGLTIVENTDHASSSTSLRPISNLTLGAVLNGNKKSHRHNTHNNLVLRTLHEIIRNGETLKMSGESPNRRKSWKSFKERLKRKTHHNQSQSQSQSQHQNLNSIRRIDAVPADDLSLMVVDSGGTAAGGGTFRLSAALSAEREHTRRRLSIELDEEMVDVTGLVHADNEEDMEEGPSFGAPADQPVRASLMELLEETDRQAGVSGPTYRLGDDEEDEEEEEKVVQEMRKGEVSCCVCMVRHKGAAFIPCGHTFCRLCSRELFVQRGNCPLCNNFILEILDIF
ncbi:hypothetical protein RND81_05G222600 [Saponaria officinalis]|uniref:RING-type domain-containing protein n=1 Tax=Saponaria officinalis TaxID=3572 RepID=A0AAW1KV49_SAPOF